LDDQVYIFKLVGQLASGQVMSLMFIIPGLWLLFKQCFNIQCLNSMLIFSTKVGGILQYVLILFYYSLLNLVVSFNADLKMPSVAVSVSLLLFCLLLMGYVLNRGFFVERNASSLVNTTSILSSCFELCCL
jgi:hypothetical protein